MRGAALRALALLFVLAAVPARGADELANLVWLEAPQPLPETGFLAAGGRTETFAAWRGRAVVLNFWATWCPPCVEEMPSLDRLAAAHGGPHLDVVAMALDRADEQRILDFYRRIGIDRLAIYRDPDLELAAALGIFGLPTTLLVDHDGMVVARLVGEAVWDSAAAQAVVLALAERARQAQQAQQAAPDDG